MRCDAMRVARSMRRPAALAAPRGWHFMHGWLVGLQIGLLAGVQLNEIHDEHAIAGQSGHFSAAFLLTRNTLRGSTMHGNTSELAADMRRTVRRAHTSLACACIAVRTCAAMHVNTHRSPLRCDDALLRSRALFDLLPSSSSRRRVPMRFMLIGRGLEGGAGVVLSPLSCVARSARAQVNS